MRRTLTLLVLLFVLPGLSLAPAASASCLARTDGLILFPYPSATPPPFNQDWTPTFQGILVFELGNLLPGQEFWLYPAHGANPPLAPCIVESCAYLPDFNVAFYRSDGDVFHTQVGQAYAAPGPVTGVVPSNAHYGLVWMRLGLDVLGHSPASGEFTFAQGCLHDPW